MLRNSHESPCGFADGKLLNFSYFFLFQGARSTENPEGYIYSCSNLYATPGISQNQVKYILNKSVVHVIGWIAAPHAENATSSKYDSRTALRARSKK